MFKLRYHLLTEAKMEEDKGKIFISKWLIAIFILITVGVVWFETWLSFSPGVEFIAIFSLFTSFILIFYIYTKVLKKDWKK